MTYPVVLIRSEEGFAVQCPALPGCWSQGASEAEAMDNIASAIREHLEVAGRTEERIDFKIAEVIVAEAGLL